MRVLTLLSLLVSYVSCSNLLVQNAPTSNSLTKNVDSTTRQKEVTLWDINNTIGVIILKDNYSETDTVRLFNNDGSLWYKFTYFYDDSDGKFDYSNDDFQPFAFNPDNFVLALKTISVNEDEYYVVVNEITGLRKKIKMTNYFQLLTWEQYVLKAFSIGFNQNDNIIFTEPSVTSKKIPYKVNSYYYPVKVENEWLKIKWSGENELNYGWIRWKEKNRLLIEIY